MIDFSIMTPLLGTSLCWIVLVGGRCAVTLAYVLSLLLIKPWESFVNRLWPSLFKTVLTNCSVFIGVTHPASAHWHRKHVQHANLYIEHVDIKFPLQYYRFFFTHFWCTVLIYSHLSNNTWGPCYIIPYYFSYRINFRTDGKIALFTLRRCASSSPALSKNPIVLSDSKVLHRSVPDLFFTLDFQRCGTYRITFRVINKGSDFRSATRAGLQWFNVNKSLIRYKNRDAPMQSDKV